MPSSTPSIVCVSGSPAHQSRTLQLADHVAVELGVHGFDVQTVNVRELPAEDLLFGTCASAPVQRALKLVEGALGVVIASPIYKASYTGLLKTFLDLLPQYGLAGKVVLPLMVGGSAAHVLALDYALRPVLLSLGAQHVVAGLFMLDKLLQRSAHGELEVDASVKPRLDAVIHDFADSLARVIPARAIGVSRAAT